MFSSLHSLQREEHKEQDEQEEQEEQEASVHGRQITSVRLLSAYHCHCGVE